jgi:hypothetical protein
MGWTEQYNEYPYECGLNISVELTWVQDPGVLPRVFIKTSNEHIEH